MNKYNRQKLRKNRQLRYEKLNKSFRIKHDIICNWMYKKYTFSPNTIEGEIFLEKFKSFFTNEYGDLPHSFNYVNVDFSFNINFDDYPVEKLQELYNKIEIIFPEPFIQINRLKKLKKLNSI